MPIRSWLGKILITILISTVGTASAVAQEDYPTKPIRLIVATAPGGSSDTLARLFAHHLTETLGQPVIVENRAGGSNIVGTQAAVVAPPDGYTLLLVSIAAGANPALFKELPYDVTKDLSLINMVLGVPLVLVVHPSVPARTVEELIALAKEKSGELNYGTAGVGGSNYLAGALFTTLTGIEAEPIAYDGGGEIATALLGGQIHMAFSTIPSVASYIESGELIALGVTSAERVPELPDVPTMKEAGLETYELIDWKGFAGPAGLPAPVVEKLHDALETVLANEELRKAAAGMGVLLYGTTPQGFSDFLESEIARWALVVKESGITPE